MANNPAALMGATMGISAISSIGDAYAQSEALKSQAKMDEAQGRINSQFAEMQAQDALEKGDKASNLFRAKTSRLKGAQRAALAAQGIDLSSGSAKDIQDETALFSERDALAIKNNAWLEAWGYRSQAVNMRNQAAMTSAAKRNLAGATLLTGGLKAMQYGLKGYAFTQGEFSNTKDPYAANKLSTMDIITGE